jgi:hypothetical protein
MGSAVALSLLVVKSTSLAVAAYIVGCPLIMLALEPFAGLLFFVIFFYLKPQQFVPGLLDAPIILITGGAALASTVTKFAFQRQHFAIHRAPQDYFMWWFFIAMLASHLAHADLAKAAEAGYTFLSVMVLYFLVTNLVTDARRLRIILYVIAVMTLVLAIQGIVQYFAGSGIGGQTVVEEGRIQSLGQFSNPNALALALVVVVPFYFFELSRSSVFAKSFVLLALPVVLFALYLTNSRGGVLAFAGVTTVMFISRYGLARGALFAAAMGVFAVVFVRTGESWRGIMGSIC